MKFIDTNIALFLTNVPPSEKTISRVQNKIAQI